MGRSRQRGVSLLEVLAAMTLFAIVATGLAAGTIQAMRRTADNRSGTAAVLLAQQELERLRGLDYGDVADHSQGATVNGQSYTIVTDVENDTPAAGMKRLTVGVSWTAAIGPRSYVARTILTSVN